MGRDPLARVSVCSACQGFARHAISIYKGSLIGQDVAKFGGLQILRCWAPRRDQARSASSCYGLTIAASDNYAGQYVQVGCLRSLKGRIDLTGGNGNGGGVALGSLDLYATFVADFLGNEVVGPIVRRINQ